MEQGLTAALLPAGVHTRRQAITGFRCMEQARNAIPTMWTVLNNRSYRKPPRFMV